MRKNIKSKKTNFDLWLEDCKNNDTNVALIEEKKNRGGVKLRLYKLIREISPSPATGWNCAYQTAYILWTGTEHYENVRDLITGLQVVNHRMNEGE